MSFFLEIAILSYNRTKELERTLLSLKEINRDDVKVCIYEDCSPNQKLIEDICNNYVSQLSIPLEFKPAHENLGYDKNLIRAISSQADYVLLLSDDDYIASGFFDEAVEFLQENQPDVTISPFTKRSNQYRKGGHYIEGYSVDVLYDSVLFSGLVFKTASVNLTNKEAIFLSRSIYSQVYLAGKHWNNGCKYFKKSLIIAGEDGENYFGLNEVSSDMTELIDRSSLMSNLYYQENLYRVAFRCISNFHPDLIDTFILNYSKRLVSHFLRVRLNTGIINYLKSVFELRRIKIKFKRIYIIPIFFIAIFPQKILLPIYKILIKKFRVSGG